MLENTPNFEEKILHKSCIFSFENRDIFWLRWSIPISVRVRGPWVIVRGIRSLLSFILVCLDFSIDPWIFFIIPFFDFCCINVSVCKDLQYGRQNILISKISIIIFPKYFMQEIVILVFLSKWLARIMGNLPASWFMPLPWWTFCIENVHQG